ncbi:alpha-L RNA-binding motif-containing protein [Dentipellis sp. KUC8613]|nr:alpha-L RNA-binding motif-containing protein [Dentipellis sp. KUC8613]
MRDANVFSINRVLPRMSWNKMNLYNLWRRSYDPAWRVDFKKLPPTLFQQRWKAKSLVRAYHGDFINEKTFKRWYLPSTLPDVRPRRASTTSAEAVELNKWARQQKKADRQTRRAEEDSQELAPVGSLMFSEVERRIDVFIFRCCLAHSVYEARRLVVHGDVLLNGKKHQNANTRLAPGDMVSVNPDAIRMLKPIKEEPVAEDEAAPADEAKPEAEVEETDAAAAESEGAEVEASAADEAADSASEPSPPARQVKKPFKKAKKSDLTPFNLPPYASPFIFLPAYVEVSFATCTGIYVRHPTARPGYSEIPTPYDADGEIVRLAWEWYSKVRPRMRSKSQLARMPENRQ